MLFLSYLELATTMNDDVLVTCIIGGALKMEVAMIISLEQEATCLHDYWLKYHKECNGLQGYKTQMAFLIN